MIRVFIGSHKRFERVEPVIEYSIRKHASEPVEINIMRPEYYGCEDSGCTGFSRMRYEIPKICNYEGFAIYLDVDMILMADIKELWDMRGYNEIAQMFDGSSEVMVIDCSGIPRSVEEEFRRVSLSSPCRKIPKEWNCEDYNYPNWNIEDAKLIHFTDLKSQPWFGGTKYPELAQLWFDMEEEALEANKQ